MELNIIVPVYNERLLAENTLRKLCSLPISKRIVVIDDGSSDGSLDVLKKLSGELNFMLLTHESNRGKGAAIKTGLKKADSGWTIIFDADSEYDPEDIINLMENKLEGCAIYGSRFFYGRASNQPRIHFIANKLLTKLSNILFHPPHPLTDIETCLKLIPTDTIKGLDLKQNDFSIEIEITAKLLKKAVPIKEVPINYHYRDYKEGKKINFYDGIKAIIALLTEWAGR